MTPGGVKVLAVRLGQSTASAAPSAVGAGCRMETCVPCGQQVVTGEHKSRRVPHYRSWSERKSPISCRSLSAGGPAGEHRCQDPGSSAR